MPTISVSQLSTKLTCARMGHLKYDLNRVPNRDKSAGLNYGDASHKYWEQKFMGNPWKLPKLESDIDQAKICAQILSWDKNEWNKWEDRGPFMCEVDFKVKLGRGWNLAGYMDGVFRDAQGWVWILEHKTTSSSILPGSRYWDEMRWGYQSNGYHLAAGTLYPDSPVRGVVYNVVKKLALRPKKTETMAEFSERCEVECNTNPGKYFASKEFRYTRGEQESFLCDVDEVLEGQRLLASQGLYPRNRNACFNQWGRKCDYYAVCCQGADINGDTYKDRERR